MSWHSAGDNSTICGVNNADRVKASARGVPSSTTPLAGVAVTTSGHSSSARRRSKAGSASSPAIARVVDQGAGTRRAARGNAHALDAQAVDEGIEVRAALHTGADDQQRAVRVRRQPGGEQRHGRGAALAVTVGPSMISRRSPLATSNTTTSPWMVGRALPALAGVVMSLVTASVPSVEGITNSVPWPASGITMRGGT